jgi:hypothetical protein
VTTIISAFRINNKKQWRRAWSMVRLLVFLLVTDKFLLIDELLNTMFE